MLEPAKVKSVCPFCRKKCDCASVMSQDEPVQPKNGDVSICIGCGCISIFDDTTTGDLRVPTIKELGDITNDTLVMSVLSAIETTKRKLGNA